MAAKLLNDDIVRQVKDLFDSQLVNPVEMVFFTTSEHCDTCQDTHQILTEVSAISEKIHLQEYDLDKNPQLAQVYNVEMTPYLVITGTEGDDQLDYGLRFAGIPSGYEFTSLIQAILLVSKRDSGLSSQIREELKGITHPINLKVFVTPT